MHIWYEKLPYPLVFLAFMVAAFLIAFYIKDEINRQLPDLPGFVIVIIAAIIIILLFRIAKIKLPFWG